jgi:hypothetical protein
MGSDCRAVRSGGDASGGLAMLMQAAACMAAVAFGSLVQAASHGEWASTIGLALLGNPLLAKVPGNEPAGREEGSVECCIVKRERKAKTRTLDNKANAPRGEA